MFTLDHLIRIIQFAKEKNATDVHITAGAVPVIRTEGQLAYSSYDKILPKDTENIINEILCEEQKKKLKDTHYISSPLVLKSIGRLRANIYMQRGSYSFSIKLLDRLLKTPDELRIPGVVIDLYKQKSGLILICGNKKSGKSTTMASIIKKISMERECHIITVEDPIEYLFRHEKSIVSQKEVGIDINSLLDGVNSAMDQDPDVIMVSYAGGDPQTFSAALSAAENCLVITTLQTPDTISTIEYINGMFPQDKRDHIKIQLCSVLSAVISQCLIPGISGYDNILATEVMLANQAMKNLILENKTHQIPAVIKTSKSLGMMTMEDSINELYSKKLISKQDAFSYISGK